MESTSEGTACPSPDASIISHTRITCVGDQHDVQYVGACANDNTAAADDDVAWAATLEQLCAAVAADEAAAAEEQLRISTIVEFLNAGQRGNSWTPPTVMPVRLKDFDEVATKDLPKALEALARPQTPVVVWNGNRAWCRAAVRALRGLSIGVNRVVTSMIVSAIASFAESRTGRSVTAGYESIARRAKLPSPAGAAAKKILQRIYGALLEVGAAIKLTPARHLTPIEQVAAQAHHGGEQRWVAHHIVLTMPAGWRESAAAAAPRSNKTVPVAASEASPAAVEDGGAANGEVSGSVHLSVISSVRRDSSVSQWYSSARKRPRAKKQAQPKSTQRTHHDLATQRLAAQLVAPADGLLQGLHRAYGADGERHIGELCTLLVDAGVDPARWSARDVRDALCAAITREGRTWIVPDYARGYLRFWLSKVDFAGPSPSELAQARAEAARVVDAPVVEAQAPGTPASSSVRAAAMRKITAALPSNRRGVMRRHT